MTSFKFDGVDSRRHGLFVTGRGVYSAPEREIEWISVPGRDGDVPFDGGRYKNRTLSLPCFFHADKTPGMAKRTRELKAWLYGRQVGYYPLYLSSEPGYYVLASFAGPLDIDSAIARFAQFDLEFNCQPWRYIAAGQQLQEITGTGILVNPCAFSSLPYIRLTGSGNISLTVGNKTWTFSGVDGYIEMDSEIMDTFRGTLSQNGKKTGEGYPSLLPGANNFLWSGAVTKIEVKPRWRTL